MQKCLEKVNNGQNVHFCLLCTVGKSKLQAKFPNQGKGNYGPSTLWNIMQVLKDIPNICGAMKNYVQDAALRTNVQQNQVLELQL